MEFEIGTRSTESRPTPRGHGLRPRGGVGAAFAEYAGLLVLMTLVGLVALNGVAGTCAAYLTVAANGL